VLLSGLIDGICGAKEEWAEHHGRIPIESSIVQQKIMLMSQLVTPNERAFNADVVVSLAQKIHQPLPIVKKVYEHEFARLKATARIPDYIVLFAARRTKDILARRKQAREAADVEVGVS